MGKIFLVGAGPGDPGLLTIRGKEVLERADVVVYDGLVNEALLRHAPKAEHVFVGKSPERHPLTQDDISRVLIEQAGKVACVVRLKGGDPFVFGRGGEEAEAFSKAGIPFEIVPGITAGIAAPAYAGIPITHRGKATRVTFITGHLENDDKDETKDPADFPKEGTLVIYMGVKNIASNVDAVLSSGRPADTPVAVIEWGTHPRQRTVTGTLDDIHAKCDRSGLTAPSIIVVGEVVSLRDTLAWFESRPLFGKRVAVTRTRERSATLIDLLQESGAEVFEFPTVQIATEDSLPPLETLSTYDWIILTSINGVDTLFEQMAAHGQDARDLYGIKLCAISARTAQALEARALRVDLTPQRYEPDHVIRDLEQAGGPVAGKHFLMPRADIGRSALPKALRESGAIVDELQAYRTAVPKDAQSLADDLVKFAPHYVTFTSAAAARHYHEIMGPKRIEELQASYAAIGPIAAQAAGELGLKADIVPEIHRVPELVNAIAASASSNEKS